MSASEIKLSRARPRAFPPSPRCCRARLVPAAGRLPPSVGRRPNWPKLWSRRASWGAKIDIASSTREQLTVQAPDESCREEAAVVAALETSV